MFSFGDAEVELYVLNQTITVSWDEHLKISFQFSTYTAKKTPFRSEIMRYNDLEQTNTLFLRENRNQNAGNSANATVYLHTCRLNQDRWMLSNQYIVFCHSEQFIANLFHVFYSSHSAYYVWPGFARS